MYINTEFLNIIQITIHRKTKHMEHFIDAFRPNRLNSPSMLTSINVNPIFLTESQNFINFAPGGMAEWSNAAVLKTVVPQGTGGSNPSSSAQTPKSPIERSGFFIWLQPEPCLHERGLQPNKRPL
jgi:hypothetical protein